MSTDKLIARVQKLLALAGNNANEAEAAAAIAKAHEILEAANLDMASVIERGDVLDKDEGRVRFDTDMSGVDKYAGWIWTNLANANYCKCIYQQLNQSGTRRKYILIGRKVNCIVVAEMAVYLVNTMKRLTREASPGFSAAWSRSYMQGIARSLCIRIRAMEKAPVGTNGALVLWRGAEDEANDLMAKELFAGTISTARQRRSTVHGEAYRAGIEAGKGISLNRQVGAAPAPKRIS